jgi:phosphate transport system permease protein
MSAIADPAYALTPSGNLRRRLWISRIFQLLTLFASALAVLVLLVLIFEIVRFGAKNISWSVLTHDLPGGPSAVPGIGPALLGTAIIVAIATVIAVPLGVFAALYLSEFASPWLAGPVSTALDVMAGLPTIVIGAFIFVIWVVPHGQSAIGGSFALAIVMTPLVARAGLESIRRVPSSLRDAADALGIAKWRTVVTVVLPTASSGIVTGSILAVARAAGETAPLLFASAQFGFVTQWNPFKPMPNVPLLIYGAMQTGEPQQVQLAWGAALVLMVMILFANILARIMLRRGERKRGL